MIKLPDRLLEITHYIIDGETMADIGSDHALLPCYAVAIGLCPKAVCGELTDGPFLRAQKAVIDCRLEEFIEVRKGNGMAVLEPGEVSTVVMAGMGGNTIVDILEQCAYADTYKRLVLQPAGALAEIRTYIADRGWRIEDEFVVKDRGYFVNIVVRPETKEGYTLTEAEKEFGPVLLRRASESAVRGYLIYREEKYKRIIRQICEQGGEEARLTGEKYALLNKQLEEIIYGR